MCAQKAFLNPKKSNNNICTDCFLLRALSGRAIRCKSSPERVRGPGFPLLSLT